MNFVMKLRVKKIIIYYHPTYLKKKNASLLLKFHTVKKMKIGQKTFSKILQQL